MKYPKPMMSITELTALGFSRDYLQKAVHCKHSDEFAYRTGRGGKFMVDTEKFDKAIRKKWIGF